MKPKKQSEPAAFNSVAEYMAFYRRPSESKPPKKGKYYRMGVSVAKMACEKATHGNNVDRRSVGV